MFQKCPRFTHDLETVDTVYKLKLKAITTLTEQRCFKHFI